MLKPNFFRKSFICILLLLLHAVSVADTIRQTKYWLGMNLDGEFPQDNKVLYFFTPQVRFVGRANKFEFTQDLFGLGYQLFRNWNVWAGYELVSHNNVAGIARQNRIWEQLMGTLRSPTIVFLDRTRLEERQRVDQPQWAERFRQRMTLQFPDRIAKNISPVIWDEIFFNITRPVWVNQNFFNQNRAFVGIDIATSKNSFFEIGYLNQYELVRQRTIVGHVIYTFFNVHIPA